ncbi:hypothetical protein [Pasteurella multocida]
MVMSPDGVPVLVKSPALLAMRFYAVRLHLLANQRPDFAQNAPLAHIRRFKPHFRVCGNLGSNQSDTGG